MSAVQLNQIFGGALDLIPHIEEMAWKYTMRNYVMPSRVTIYTDMPNSWNNRKISEYIRTRRAQTLAEDTAIPDHIINRVRESEIAPQEVGDRYRITDRRAGTDLENILADTIQFLGQAIGDRKEADLISAALSSFKLGTLGSPSTTFTVDLPASAQFEFMQRAVRDQIYLVVHPFQVKDVITDLMTVTGTTAGVNLNFREQAIRGFTIPVFNGLNLAVSEFLPRKVVHKLSVYGTSGTFRLEIGTGQTVGTDITAAISCAVSGNTVATNVAAALNALTGQSGWTAVATGDDPERITVTAPSYLDAESELRVAIDPSNPTLPNRKSAYDLVGTLGGNEPTDSGGDALGVVVAEISADAKSLMFTRDALVYDIREPVKAYRELVMQGRTLEVSAYEKYGVGHWRDDRGLFIQTDATRPLAVAI